MSENAVSGSIESLVREAQQGSQRAWEGLVTRHYALVHTIAYSRLNDPEAAEDLVQEVFLRAFLQIAHLRKPASFPFWVGRMARHLGTTWSRNQQRRSALVPLVSAEEDGMENIGDPQPTPRETAEDNQRDEQLRAAIHGLPPKEREATLLHYVDGLPKNVVAQHMGLHPATVGRMLDRACVRLKVQVGDEHRTRIPAVTPPKRGPEATIACIGAVAAMTPGAREALATAASKGLSAAVSYHTSTSAGTSTVGFFALLCQSLQSTIEGVIVMGTFKTASIATASVAVIAVGGAVVMNNRSDRPTGAASSSSLLQASMAPTNRQTAWNPGDLLRTPGNAWEFQHVMEVDADGAWTEYVRMDGSCRVASVDPQNNSTFELNIGEVHAHESWGTGPSGVSGTSYYVKGSPDGQITDVRTTTGAPISPMDAMYVLMALQGTDLGPLVSRPGMSIGEKGDETFRISLPGSSGYVEGRVDYELTSVNEASGRKTAVFSIKTDTEVGGNMPVGGDERTRTLIVLESQRAVGEGQWVYDLDGRLRGEMISEGTNTVQNINLVIPIPGQRQPLVRPIETPQGQRFRTRTSFTQL